MCFGRGVVFVSEFVCRRVEVRVRWSGYRGRSSGGGLVLSSLCGVGGVERVGGRTLFCVFCRGVGRFFEEGEGGRVRRGFFGCEG